MAASVRGVNFDIKCGWQLFGLKKTKVAAFACAQLSRCYPLPLQARRLYSDINIKYSDFKRLFFLLLFGGWSSSMTERIPNKNHCWVLFTCFWNTWEKGGTQWESKKLFSSLDFWQRRDTISTLSLGLSWFCVKTRVHRCDLRNHFVVDVFPSLTQTSRSRSWIRSLCQKLQDSMVVELQLIEFFWETVIFFDEKTLCPRVFEDKKGGCFVLCAEIMWGPKDIGDGN